MVDSLETPSKTVRRPSAKFRIPMYEELPEFVKRLDREIVLNYLWHEWTSQQSYGGEC